MVLTQFPPSMHILLVTKETTEGPSGALSLDTALAKTRELLKIPEDRAEGAT